MDQEDDVESKSENCFKEIHPLRALKVETLNKQYFYVSPFILAGISKNFRGVINKIDMNGQMKIFISCHQDVFAEFLRWFHLPDDGPIFINDPEVSSKEKMPSGPLAEFVVEYKCQGIINKINNMIDNATEIGTGLADIILRHPEYKQVHVGVVWLITNDLTYKTENKVITKKQYIKFLESELQFQRTMAVGCTHCMLGTEQHKHSRSGI